MDHKLHHAPLGFPTEPKPNQRINNKFLISVLDCAKSVENSIFAKKNHFPPTPSHVIETKEPHPKDYPRTTQEIPRKPKQSHPVFTPTAVNRKPRLRNKRKQRQKCYHERLCPLKPRRQKIRRIS